MLSNDIIIKVTNRDSGSVGYNIPDMGNLYRVFATGETKELTYEELKKLSYIPGGQFILKNCLIIDNKEALKELLGEVEPEYFYTEEDIKKLLTVGTLNQFKDCLDFAPEGVIDLVKKMAVDLKISDINKRDAIFKKTGFNVTKAIEFNELNAVEENTAETPVKVRRAEPINASEEAPVRRTTPPKYKVTSIIEK